MFSIALGDGPGDGFGMFIPGIFMGLSGEADGVGDAFGICIAGIFICRGVAAGEAFGVGDGIGIVCPGCCAKTGTKGALARKIRTDVQAFLCGHNFDFSFTTRFSEVAGKPHLPFSSRFNGFISKPLKRLYDL
jgi:hypothetical protein